MGISQIGHFAGPDLDNFYLSVGHIHKPGIIRGKVGVRISCIRWDGNDGQDDQDCQDH